MNTCRYSISVQTEMVEGDGVIWNMFLTAPCALTSGHELEHRSNIQPFTVENEATIEVIKSGGIILSCPNKAKHA